MELTEYRDDDGFAALHAEWNDLLRRSRFDTIFLTYEWQTTWVATSGLGSWPALSVGLSRKRPPCWYSSSLSDRGTGQPCAAGGWLCRSLGLPGSDRGGRAGRGRLRNVPGMACRSHSAGLGLRGVVQSACRIAGAFAHHSAFGRKAWLGGRHGPGRRLSGAGPTPDGSVPC